MLLHFQSSTGGFRCALPEKLSGELSGELEAWWGLPKSGIVSDSTCWKIPGFSESRFKANSALGVSFLLVLLMSGGHLRAITGLSEAFQWGVGGVVPAHRCPAPGFWVGCGWPDYSSARWCGGVEPRDLGMGRDSPGLSDQSSLTLRPGIGGSGPQFIWGPCLRDTLAFQPRAPTFSAQAGPDIFSPGGALGPEGPGDESFALYIYTRGIFQKRK